MGTFRPHEDLPNGQLWLYADADSKIDVSSVLTPFELVTFPHADDFHPLGIELDVDAETLYVVSHAQAGSCIEVFRVDLSTARLTYVETIRHPLIQAPNSIVSLGDGRLYVTNDHKFRARVAPVLAKVETFSGFPGGTVVYIETQRPETAKVVARVPFANGRKIL